MWKKGSSSRYIGIYEYVPYSKQATHLTNHCLKDTTVITASADLLRILGGLVQPWGGGTTTCRSHQWYLVGSSGSIPEDTHPSLHWQYTPCCSPLLHCKSSCCRWELPHEPGGSMQYCPWSNASWPLFLHGARVKWARLGLFKWPDQCTLNSMHAYLFC